MQLYNELHQIIELPRQTKWNFWDQNATTESLVSLLKILGITLQASMTLASEIADHSYST